jgi:hypothetical protein
MPDWRCVKCNADNRPEGNFCRMCGEPRSAKDEPRSTGSAASVLGSQGSQRKSMLDDLRGDSADAFKKSRAQLDQLRSELPKLAELPNLQDTSREAGQPRMASLPKLSELPKLADLDFDMPDIKSASSATPTIERVTTRSMQIRTLPLPNLNYALAHCGVPLIPALEIQNNSNEDALDVLIKAWVATDYGEPWQKTIPKIPAHKSYVEKGIVVPLTKSRLQEVREAERANLRIDVFSEGELQISETYPMEVLAYNEWFYHPDLVPLMACFVQPNSEAIERIISMVRDRLRKEFKDTSLDGYQSGDPRKVLRMLEALYLTLQKDLELSYINPPPSFESPNQLPDGTITFSQKVFFPEQIFKHRRGTCLDLALMCAACVERMGLRPLCFLIRGHAFFGAWLVEGDLPVAAVSDHATVMQLISQGIWLPINSTNFAAVPHEKFKTCLDAGLEFVSDPETFMCAVDVRLAHRSGFKPVPPLVGSGL